MMGAHEKVDGRTNLIKRLDKDLARHIAELAHKNGTMRTAELMEAMGRWVRMGNPFQEAAASSAPQQTTTTTSRPIAVCMRCMMRFNFH